VSVGSRESNLEKRPCLFCARHSHFSPRLAWQLDALSGIARQQLPAHGLA
jgi:hypothetical protein